MSCREAAKLFRVSVSSGVRWTRLSDPRLLELRAWSRLAEELQEERVRLSNRVHRQL
jgi:transposase